MIQRMCIFSDDDVYFQRFQHITSMLCMLCVCMVRGVNECYYVYLCVCVCALYHTTYSNNVQQRKTKSLNVHVAGASIYV